jgi:hypothetical protein
MRTHADKGNYGLEEILLFCLNELVDIKINCGRSLIKSS